MAHIFDISTHALTVPDIDTYIGLMNTLFALEDMYELKIGKNDGEICLRLDKSDYSTYVSMFDMLHARQEQAAKLAQGELTKEKYDHWRYKYPELDTSKHWAKIPSQAVSDSMLNGCAIASMEELAKIEKGEKKTAKKKNRNKHKKTLPIFSFQLQPHYCAVVPAFVKWKCKHFLLTHCPRKISKVFLMPLM